MEDTVDREICIYKNIKYSLYLVKEHNGLVFAKKNIEIDTYNNYEDFNKETEIELYRSETNILLNLYQKTKNMDIPDFIK